MILILQAVSASQPRPSSRRHYPVSVRYVDPTSLPQPTRPAQTPVPHRVVLTVTCPVCRSGRGQRCVRLRKDQRAEPRSFHTRRIALARRLEANPAA